MDARFYEQASELNDMKERLDEAETKHRQGIACSKKLEQQCKQLLQHHRKILHHISRVITKSYSNIIDVHGYISILYHGCKIRLLNRRVVNPRPVCQFSWMWRFLTALFAHVAMVQVHVHVSYIL